jgi:FKBP-type peptidyl-prolyl cis-trans isomerase FklB
MKHVLTAVLGLVLLFDFSAATVQGAAPAKSGSGHRHGNIFVPRSKRQMSSEELVARGKAFLAENAKKEGVKTLPSGLQYRIIIRGTGKKPKPTDLVTIHYQGTLIDGTEFGSSSRSNKPANFKVSSLIPGLAEALPLMKEGATWRLFLPPELAFRERGPLEDRTVIYEVELISVHPE